MIDLRPNAAAEAPASKTARWACRLVLAAAVVSLLAEGNACLGAGQLAAAESSEAPTNPSDREVLEKWTPNGDTNAHDLPYRHRIADYERHGESDWLDGRWQDTDWGPFFAHSTLVDNQPVRPKNLVLFLNEAKSTAAMFDLEYCGLRSLATEAQLKIDPVRFGLLRKPKLSGTLQVNVAADPLWTMSKSPTTVGEPRRASAATVSYRGLRLRDRQVLLEYTVAETPVAEAIWQVAKTGGSGFVRRIEVGPAELELSYVVAAGDATNSSGDSAERRILEGGLLTVVRLLGTSTVEPRDKNGCETPQDAERQPRLTGDAAGVRLSIPPGDRAVTIDLVVWRGATTQLPNDETWKTASQELAQFSQLRTPGGLRWGEPLATKKVMSTSDNGAYVVDDFPTPTDNPYKALFFCSSLDFFPDGTAAVCTAHGDVWLVRGLSDEGEQVTWQRYATGLFQPLGLKVIDGKVIVLGNDQLTRLHDLNGDGEADWYESMNHDLRTFGQDHAYAMRLEADPEGRLYFLKAGAPPHGSALYRVSSDARKLERIATGFRHPFGMGVSPTGEVTVADNEGNWVPSSKIDLIKPEGFYGYAEGLKGSAETSHVERPLCYIPKVADNACGGQVWATSDRWGDYHRGRMIHFSWGRATMHAVLEQRVGDVRQAATVQYPGISFHAGPGDAEFSPADGQMYVVGLNGWQCHADGDGFLSRVRYTGKPVQMPSEFSVHANGIVIRFPEPLDPAWAVKRERYRINQWNYRRSNQYGSYHYSPSDPEKIGHDAVAIDRAELLPDGKSVFLQIGGLKPVDQIHVHVDLRSKNGQAQTHDIYGTINAVGEAFPLDGEQDDSTARDARSLFAAENLFAWCIVPFDAKQRGPRERVEMLERLGLSAVAYDWRDEHVPQFDEELSLYKEHGIELVGFWTPVGTVDPLGEPAVAKVLSAIERSGLPTQLWVTLGDGIFEDVPMEKRVGHAASVLGGLARKARTLGCSVGLYNHGGWFGDVDRQIAIIKRLEKEEIWNVGIVYNLHHGHRDVGQFNSLLARMRPYLYALNLNGMRREGPKILPIGQGDDDASLLQAIVDSGYRGPVGILGHRDEVDAEKQLADNLKGLQSLLGVRSRTGPPNERCEN